MLFFECQIKYQKQTGEDNPAQVKESYLIEGVTPSDAESCLMQEIGPYIFGESEVQSIRKRNFYDILPKDGDGDQWFQCKVEFITIQDNGVETRKPVNMLVQDGSIQDALKRAQEYLISMDCEFLGISKSPILEVWRAIQEAKNAE